jgi:hypothetical protein
VVKTFARLCDVSTHHKDDQKISHLLNEDQHFELAASRNLVKILSIFQKEEETSNGIKCLAQCMYGDTFKVRMC